MDTPTVAGYTPPWCFPFIVASLVTWRPGANQNYSEWRWPELTNYCHRHHVPCPPFQSYKMASPNRLVLRTLCAIISKVSFCLSLAPTLPVSSPSIQETVRCSQSLIKSKESKFLFSKNRSGVFFHCLYIQQPVLRLSDLLPNESSYDQVFCRSCSF